MPLEKRDYIRAFQECRFGHSFPLYRYGCTLAELQTAIKYVSTLVPIFVHHEGDRGQEEFKILKVTTVYDRSDSRWSDDILVEPHVAQLDEVYVLCMFSSEGDPTFGGTSYSATIADVMATQEEAERRGAEIMNAEKVQALVEQESRAIQLQNEQNARDRLIGLTSKGLPIPEDKTYAISVADQAAIRLGSNEKSSKVGWGGCFTELLGYKVFRVKLEK
jgi:hypothetical protein